MWRWHLRVWFIGEHGAAGLTASGLSCRENILNVFDLWQKVKSLRCRRYCTSPMGLGMAEMSVRLPAILQQEQFYVSCGPKSSKCRALSLLCPLVSSNTWRVTETWPTDWKELWIINSWLVWLFWIGKALVCIGYSDLIFFPKGWRVKYLGMILFLLHNEQQCFVSLHCYILIPLDLWINLTFLTASEKVLLSSSCLKQNLFANKQGVANSVHKKHCSVQWGAPPICLSKCN